MKFQYLLLILMILFSCKKEDIPTIPPTGIIISKSVLFLNVGTSDTLKATVSPSNTSDKNVNWSSSNNNIATINSSGVITAKATGSTIISATTGTLKATCDLTVTTPMISISLPTTFMLNVGTSDSLIVTFNPSNAINKTLYWHSSNTNIATVDERGLVKPISQGIDTITVTSDDGRKTAKCILSITKWNTYSALNSNFISHMTSIAIDHQGNKWIGTYGYGISFFNGTNWVTFNENNSPLVSNFVRSIAIDSKGNKWIGTDAGVSKFDDAIWITYNRNTIGYVDNTGINSITIDAKGDKWFGTNSAGVLKFNETIWTNYNSANSGLRDNIIHAITIDLQGNKWFGTDSKGVSKFDGSSWTSYDATNSGLTENTVFSIGIDAQGNKWFGINSAAMKFDGNNWSVYYPSNMTKNQYWVTSITLDEKNNIWFTYSNTLINSINLGASKFNGVNWVKYDIVSHASWGSSGGVYGMAIDAQGNKWFATNYAGLIELQD